LRDIDPFVTIFPVQRDDDFTPSGPIRSLGYRLLWSCATAFHRAGTACTYVAAGLLHRDDFRRASRILWRDYGTLIEDVDGGLENWERRMFESALKPSDRILLVGCGAGRDLLALRELGYDVTGLDPTPELVERARYHAARRGVTAVVLEGFVETAELGVYDVVVLAGNCYSFIQGADARIATLIRLKAHLAPQGRIVITYAGALRRGSSGIRLTQLVSRVWRAHWHPERGDNFARDYFAHRLIRYEHMFVTGEVALECAEAGFHIVRDVTTAAYYVVAAPSPAGLDASRENECGYPGGP
jgi:SAM-dependent methyltransferase